MDQHNQYHRKVKITGTLAFETAFHIGSGQEGQVSANMGVLRAGDGTPILPGSTLKGSFRSFCERLAPYLGFNACLLDSDLSGVPCVTDEKVLRETREHIKSGGKELTEKQTYDIYHKKTCGICRLFGSQAEASRIFFSDGRLTRWSNALQIRDGVCIDRDTETARDQAKYDFEVVPPGAVFDVSIELVNPTGAEIALTAAALGEWQNGFRLGGFTSRGLGRVKMENTAVKEVDYTNSDQLKTYLLKRQMTPAGELLEKSLEEILKKQGGTDAKKNG